MPDASDVAPEGEWFAYAPPEETPRPWRHGMPTSPHVLDPEVPLILMPEYAVELPLWNHDWEELGLSPGLLDALADWQEIFDSNFDSEDGWRDLSVRETWARQADALADRLRRSLPAGLALKVCLWPLARDVP